MTGKSTTMLILITLIGSLTSCEPKSERSDPVLKSELERKLDWSRVKTSNDIYEVKGFIEKYPESEDFDSAMNLYFQLQQDLFDSVGIPIWDCLRNCAEIIVDSNRAILFEDRQIPIDSLRTVALGFITNSDTTVYGPEFKEFSDGHLYSKGHFSISIPENATFSLQPIVVSLRQAIQDYKLTLSKDWYHSEYSELTHDKQSEIDSIFQQRLIFWKHYKIYDPPELEEKITSPNNG